MAFLHIFRQIGLAVFLLAGLMSGIAAARSGTITNTATAHWSHQGAIRSVLSNTVSIAVAEDVAAIETLVPAASGEALSITAPTCNGSAVPIPGSVGGALFQPATALHPGMAFYFRIVAARANARSTAIDSLETTVTDASGDREVLTVFETGADTGVFVGGIQTIALPPQPTIGDCRLSVLGGDTILISSASSANAPPIAAGTLTVLADPYGLVFDSEDGRPVDGARVSLVDAQTGAPAQVYAPDGVTAWPSTVISGQAIVDGAGRSHPMLPGEYQFPLAPLGHYRIVVDPPAPYRAPSASTPAQLASLRRNDGQPMQIAPASFGEPLDLAGPAPVRIDIPVDRPVADLELIKTASRAAALPGDAVQYTITLRNPAGESARNGLLLVDRPSPHLRLRRETVRVDGTQVNDALTVAEDGQTFQLSLGLLPSGVTRRITYTMTVNPDAGAGAMLNRASVTDDRGRSNEASATVRIEREDLAQRMTLIGRVTAGGCDASTRQSGIAGVRLVLEDGSFAITDADGRYHFDGLVPGSHVVQAQPETLPPGGKLVPCGAWVRSTGNANSRIIAGQGGSLVVADFFASVPVSGKSVAPSAPDAEAAAQRAAAGADTDWLAGGDGPPAFLFPAPDHNPRAPAVRVVIRHRSDQKVALKVDGKLVDPVAFEGTRQAPGGRLAVSIWRSVPLDGEVTHLTATVHGPQGEVATELTRDVFFAGAPARFELIPERSRLVADGKTRPVLALRVLDRHGRPVRAGMAGEFRLGAPYESAEALDAMQQRSVTGLGRLAPRWQVKGDDGVALVELAPTMTSGKLRARFDLSDGQTRRHQDLEAWIVPGAQKWTVVGLAEGGVGVKGPSDPGEDARVAVYLKGPVSDGLLLTAAYDTARQRDDQTLMGQTDPRAYYSVFGDLSDRRYDAASREKLYARLDAAGFTALYGDFLTGFEQTQLGRYQRAATGFKSEVRLGALQVEGFGARIGSSHRREEFQGAGLSGPYRLSARSIVAASETVVIEVRDRFRSELVLSRRQLVRFVDYDIDLLSGTIRFTEPLLSRDADFNPQFAVLTYEVDAGAAGGALNYGVRAAWSTAGGHLRMGATAISDTGAHDGRRAGLMAFDAKAKLGSDTELRGELATSSALGQQALAWLVEVEHHGGNLDLLGYVRRAERDFGLGQTTGAELGRRKIGIDANYRLGEALSLTASAWHDDRLESRASRTAIEVGSTWRSRDTDARIGLALMRDRLVDGRTAASTTIEGGVTRRLFDNRLEVSASSSVALGSADSLDLPVRHRLAARYALARDLRLTGTYEWAYGTGLDARTGQLGVELSPWQGARFRTGLGQQRFAASGTRDFAAVSLAQSITATPHLTFDATVDSNRTLSGFDPARLVNPDHPASSGGTLGESGSIAEDFTAYTLGGTWRAGRWSATLRGEWRDGELSDRKGIRLNAVRQIDEGSMLGANATWTRATTPAGASSTLFDGALALAHRPSGSDLALLGKVQLRSDSVRGVVAGETDPVGLGSLTISGNGRSTRLVASVSGDWSPKRSQGGSFIQRGGLGFFAAIRHNFDRVDDLALAGTTLVGGGDFRIGLNDRLEVGAAGSLRTSLGDGTVRFAFGPQLGFTPAKDLLVTFGYNVAGFRDPDFSALRSTDKGLFASVRMTFDADTFGFLRTLR